MMRSKFDEQLAQLNTGLIEMGALCEQAIAMTAKALEEKDYSLAKDVWSVDSEIDKKERDIENLCLKMLLQQQPVARDLRQISAALKMITDMERIGDQASDIAEIIKYMNSHGEVALSDISKMASAVIKMVTESIDAYVRRDVMLARNVISRDDTVDEYFIKVKKDVINLIAKNPAEGECATDLLMTAKYLERIGDHAANIAEWVEFSVTGIHKGEINI